MYTKIMLALDGSDISNASVEEVIKLTNGQRDVSLKVIHVVDESFVQYGGSSFDYLAVIDYCHNEGQKILDSAANTLVNKSSLKVETSLLELNPLHGRIAEAIVDEATKWPADLLVLGTHGRRGFSRLLLGSVAENVVRIATTPVLLVRGYAV